MSTRLDASVLGIRDFRLLWTGQAISAIGDMVFPVAVAIFVLDSGGDARDVGLVLAARFAALVLSRSSGASGRTGCGLALAGPAVNAFGRGPVLGLAAVCVVPSLLVLLVPGVPEFRTPKSAGGSASGAVEVPVEA